MDKLVLEEVLHQRAKREGYQRHKEIQATLRRMMIHRLETDWMEDHPVPPISEADTEAFYHQHADEFSLPEQRLGAVLFLRTPLTATDERVGELHARMKSLRSQALLEEQLGEANKGFGLLAQRHSEDQTTRYRGGELGWKTAAEVEAHWGRRASHALFELQRSGDISPIIATEKGLVLIKLEAVQPASLKPLEEVREAIHYQLTRASEHQQREAFYAEQKAGVDIQINTALLGTIPPPSSNTPVRLPALPGATRLTRTSH